MNKLRGCALGCALAILLAACGGTTHSTTTIIQAAATPQQQATLKAAATVKVAPTTKAQDAVSCPPPPGEGVLGACTPKPVQVFGTKVVPVDPAAPASIPDVSSWQGNVNWPAVKAWQVAHHFTPGGIFKMGEYVLDPFAARNNAALRDLHMWRAGYWFLRNTGCAHEAGQIVSEARALGLRVVFLDDEVSEARGYDGCLTPILKRAGLIVGEYASPGAYPGGSRSDNPAWIAAYGPSNPPLAPWGGPIKAFQCTDGIFGCVTDVPGLGRVDMSVNFGITNLGASAPKPHKPRDPYRKYDKTVRHFKQGTASERGTVSTWDRVKCSNPARRSTCKASNLHLRLLRGRLFAVAHRYHRGDVWGSGRGSRYQGMQHRLTAPRGTVCTVRRCG